jgi:hypothetical protein
MQLEVVDFIGIQFHYDIDEQYGFIFMWEIPNDSLTCDF